LICVGPWSATFIWLFRLLLTWQIMIFKLPQAELLQAIRLQMAATLTISSAEQPRLRSQ
jgi:hypothetical protein